MESQAILLCQHLSSVNRDEHRVYPIGEYIGSGRILVRWQKVLCYLLTSADIVTANLSLLACPSSVVDAELVCCLLAILKVNLRAEELQATCLRKRAGCSLESNPELACVVRRVRS